jgi:hypothetical protein
MEDISQKAVLGAFARHGLTQPGADFVLMAADPFHDQNYRIVGLPDATSGRSRIATIRQEISIEKPGSIAPGDTWSAHVAFMPVVCGDGNGSSSSSVTAPLCDQVTTEDANALILSNAQPAWGNNGSVVVVSVQAGSGPSFDPASAGCTYQTVDVPELCDRTERARLLGGGYEIHNTTEELHRSGQVTDYRVDSDLGPSIGMVPGTGGPTPMMYLKGTLPPNTLGSAKQINGVTREAADGSMVVICRDQHSHAAELPFQGYWILNRYDEQAVPGTTDGICCTTPDVATPFEGEPPALPYCRELPFMQSGSYYTGLSYETKLNLSVVFFVEIFPSPGTSEMAYAQPAPSYDPQALELLSYIQSATLPGYPVSWNSLGRFTKWIHNATKKAARTFDKAARAAKPFLGMAAALPGPYGQIGSSVQQAVMTGQHAAKMLESGGGSKAGRRARRGKRQQV